MRGIFPCEFALLVENYRPLLVKDVTHPAFQSGEKLFQRINGDVLIGHFHTVQRGRGDSDPPPKLHKRHFSTRFAQVFSELLAKVTTHTPNVRHLSSHMWDLCFTPSCLSGKHTFSPTPSAYVPRTPHRSCRLAVIAQRKMSFWRKLLGLESKPKQVVVACSMCGQKNRLYQREHSGIYRCGSCQSPLAAPFTNKIGSEVISDYAPWGKPSSNNEIAMALEKLAKRAWTFDTSDESGDFLFTPPALLINEGSVLNQGLSALYRHARRWAPGLDIPFRVPHVRVVSAMSSAGRFQVDNEGWTTIDLGSEFLLTPKAAWLIMAHEVCHHIMAQSGEALRNDTRLNERITDVAMFVCGFGDLAKSGQTFVEATGSGYVRHHFGYLDASEYSFVHNWVIAARCANKLPGMANAKTLHPELAAGFQIKSRAVVALELLRTRIIDAGARERLLTHYRENYPLDKEEELVTRILEDHERDRR